MIIVEVSLSLPLALPGAAGRKKGGEEGKVGCLEKFVVAADAFSYVGMLRTGEGGRSPVSRTKNWIFLSLPSFIPRNPQSGCCCPAEQRQHANHRHRNKPLNLGAWPGGREGRQKTAALSSDQSSGEFWVVGAKEQRAVARNGRGRGRKFVLGRVKPLSTTPRKNWSCVDDLGYPCPLVLPGLLGISDFQGITDLGSPEIFRSLFFR